MAPTTKGDVPVYPGEKVLRSEPTVAHAPKATRGEGVFPGVLHLTDQRLIFRPDTQPTPGCPGFFPHTRIVATTVFAPKLFGLVPTSRRALRISADGARAGKEPWFVLDDPASWHAAVMQARADAPANRLGLDKILSAAEADPTAISREACGNFLAHERAFPAGFWHPEDEAGLLAVMTDALKDLGAPDVLSDQALRAELRRAVESHPDDENKARRVQISRVAARINGTVGPAASARRLYAFAEDIPGWEAGEPVWLHLTADERARLLALGIVLPLPAST